MVTRALLALALLAASGSAHADSDSLSPTDPLIGEWCAPHVPEDKGLFNRGSCRDFSIWRGGYGNCGFLEIKRTKNGLETLSDCSDNLRYERATFQIIGKRRLKFTATTTHEIKPINTPNPHGTMCLQVQPTPDGFLNLRQGPGMNFKIKAKLLPGPSVMVDYQTDTWIHLKRMCGEFGGDLNGWVYKKYLEPQEKSESEPLHIPGTTGEKQITKMYNPAEDDTLVCEKFLDTIDCREKKHIEQECHPKWLGIGC